MPWEKGNTLSLASFTLNSSVEGLLLRWMLTSYDKLGSNPACYASFSGSPLRVTS